MDFQRKVLLGAAAIDARDAFDPDERRKFLNASEAMTCIRKQWYAKHLPEAGEEQDWGYARRGTGIERYMVECLRAANVDIRYAGDDQMGLYSEEHRVSATPDGVLVTEDYLIGVEFKSIDPRVNRANLPRDGNVTQLKIGMNLFDRAKADLDLPDLPFSHGIVVYTDASNWNDIIQFDVPYDPDILESMKRRAKAALDTRNVARLPREGKMGGGKECNTQCEFKAKCMGDEATLEGTSASGRGNRGTRLDTCVQDYWAAKIAEASAKGNKDVAAERIKQELRKRDVATLDVGGRHVELVTVKGRLSLDKKAVAKADIDLSPFETRGASSERLTIK